MMESGHMCIILNNFFLFCFEKVLRIIAFLPDYLQCDAVYAGSLGSCSGRA